MRSSLMVTPSSLVPSGVSSTASSPPLHPLSAPTMSRTTQVHQVLLWQNLTVRTTINAVAQTYRAHNCPSPIHDDEGKLVFLLQHQLKGYKNNDASCKQQKALMPKILCFLHCNMWTKIDQACGELTDGTFFFAMHSCEYLKTTGKCCTKLLCLQNLWFYHDKKELPHSHPELHLTDCIAITFTFRKMMNAM